MTSSNGKHFPRYWPFVWGIHRSPVNSPHKGQWREAWMFSLICAWINGWVNNGEAGDLRRYRAHYVVIAMKYYKAVCIFHRIFFIDHTVVIICDDIAYSNARRRGINWHDITWVWPRISRVPFQYKDRLIRCRDSYHNMLVFIMMTSSNGNIFRVTGHLCGEFTGPRWIPRTKASDAELWCFFLSASE